LETQLSQKLMATLEPVVGQGHVRATVVVDYDLGSTDDTRETYEPNSAVALSMQRSEERSSDGGLGGIPGTTSNLPNSKTAAAVPAVGDGTQYSKTESGTYGVNRSVHHVVQPPGAIKRISVAVLVDDVVVQKNGTTIRTKRTPEQMQEIERIARAAVGLDPSRSDVLAIQNLPFEEAEAPAAPRLSPTQRVWTVVQRSSDLFRYVVLLALFVAAYLLLLRPLKLQVFSAIRALPAATLAAGALAASRTKAALIAPAEPKEDDENVALRRALVEKVKREPANASRLVQTWLRQTEVQK
jgi:flagellar M-ring protein FliF